MKQMIYFLLLKQQKGNNFLLEEDFLLVVFSSCFRFQSLLSFLNIYLYLDQVTLFKATAKKHMKPRGIIGWIGRKHKI